ncbi:MAG: prolipoprotein diacylglyceryl transferase, partial [bacterium]|nr:prolipoprotein diacylglyceryl transferase [bacterium]
MIFSYIEWDVNPVIVEIFGIEIRYYGALFVSGLLLSMYILERIYKRENISQEFLQKLSTYGLIGILLGARLGHCLFYDPNYYLSHPIEMFLPIHIDVDGGIEFVGYQGLASHGGAIGLIISLVLYSKKTKQPLIKTLDFIAIVTPLAAF